MKYQVAVMLMVIGILGMFAYMALTASEVQELKEAPVDPKGRVATELKPKLSHAESKGASALASQPIRSTRFEPEDELGEFPRNQPSYRLQILRSDGSAPSKKRVRLHYSSMLAGKFLTRTNERGAIRFSPRAVLDQSWSAEVALVDERPVQRARIQVGGERSSLGHHDLGILKLELPRIIASGKLITTRAKPVAKARVWLTPVYGDQTGNEALTGGLRGTQCTTDEDGQFSIDGHLDWVGDVQVNAVRDDIPLHRSHRISQGTFDLIMEVTPHTSLEVTLRLPPGTKTTKGLSLILAQDHGGFLSHPGYESLTPLKVDQDQCSQKWVGLKAGNYSLMISHSKFPHPAKEWASLVGVREGGGFPLFNSAGAGVGDTMGFLLHGRAHPASTPPTGRPNASPPTIIVRDIAVEQDRPNDPRLMDIDIASILKVVSITAAAPWATNTTGCFLFLKTPSGIKGFGASSTELAQGVLVPSTATQAFLVCPNYAYSTISPLLADNELKLQKPTSLKFTITDLSRGQEILNLEFKGSDGQVLTTGELNLLRRPTPNGFLFSVDGLPEGSYELLAAEVVEGLRNTRVTFRSGLRFRSSPPPRVGQTLSWNSMIP